MADAIGKTFDHVRKVVKEFQKNALAVIEVEAVKSVRKNFESGGRPKWIPSGKKGKTKGTRTLVVTGKLSEVTAKTDLSSNTVTLVTSPEARAYAKIQNEGGTINMPARTIRHRVNKKGETVFARKTHKRNVKETQTKAYKIVIPARPYLVIPEEDRQRILNEIKKRF
jgi:phage gpG-like protein